MGGGGGPWGQCLGTLLMLVLESERQGPLGALIAAVNAVEEQLQLLGRGGGGRLGLRWVGEGCCVSTYPLRVCDCRIKIRGCAPLWV